MQELRTVNVPFKGLLDFEVRRKSVGIQNQETHHNLSEESKIVFCYNSDSNQGEKMMIEFGGEEHFRISNNGETLIVKPISVKTMKILTHC